MPCMRDERCSEFAKTISPAVSDNFGRKKEKREVHDIYKQFCFSAVIDQFAMAKGKGKKASRADTAIPDGGAVVNGPNTGADSSPKLEESAFAGLRQKIEQRLRDQSTAKQQKSKGKAKGDAKETPKKEKEEAAPKPGPTQESKKDDKNNDNKGKKRNRNGDVIAKEEKASGKEKQSKSSFEKDDDTLRQEILVLGGTEEDLNLVAGADSESEIEDNVKDSKGTSDDDALRKELSSMLTAAGHVVPGDLDEEEGGDGEQEEGEGEEEEEEEEKEEDNGHDEGEENGDDESEEQDNDDEQEVSDAEEETPVPAKASNESAKETKEQPAKTEELPVPKQFSKLVRATRSES